jgi:hypothetical protein
MALAVHRSGAPPLEDGGENREKDRADQRLTPDVQVRRDRREVTLVQDVRNRGNDRRAKHAQAAEEERSRFLAQGREGLGPLDHRDAREPENRSGERARRQRLARQKKVAEDADPDRKSAEEERRQTRRDPLRRREHEGVSDADLQKPADADPEALVAADGEPRPAERERGHQETRQTHAHRCEVERREVSQTDLDHEPRRSPHRAAEEVDGEPATARRHRGCRARGHRRGS